MHQAVYIRNYAQNTFSDQVYRNYTDETLATEDYSLDSFLGTSYKITGTKN